LPVLIDLLAFLGCLVASAAVLACGLYAVNVAGPRLGQRLCGLRTFGAEAEARARELFLSKLTARQRRTWLARRRFTVEGASGVRYTIVPYDSYNIRAPDALFCLEVHGATPVYDKLLAQKLLIECDEPLFLATANVRSYSNEWAPRREAARRRCRERGYAVDGPPRSAGVLALSERTP
jgi:hypothetical protein